MIAFNVKPSENLGCWLCEWGEEYGSRIGAVRGSVVNRLFALGGKSTHTHNALASIVDGANIDTAIEILQSLKAEHELEEGVEIFEEEVGAGLDWMERVEGALIFLAACSPKLDRNDRYRRVKEILEK